MKSKQTTIPMLVLLASIAFTLLPMAMAQETGNATSLLAEMEITIDALDLRLDAFDESDSTFSSEDDEQEKLDEALSELEIAFNVLDNTTPVDIETINQQIADHEETIDFLNQVIDVRIDNIDVWKNIIDNSKTDLSTIESYISALSIILDNDVQVTEAAQIQQFESHLAKFDIFSGRIDVSIDKVDQYQVKTEALEDKVLAHQVKFDVLKNRVASLAATGSDTGDDAASAEPVDEVSPQPGDRESKRQSLRGLSAEDRQKEFDNRYASLTSEEKEELESKMDSMRADLESMKMERDANKANYDTMTEDQKQSAIQTMREERKQLRENNKNMTDDERVAYIETLRDSVKSSRENNVPIGDQLMFDSDVTNIVCGNDLTLVLKTSDDTPNCLSLDTAFQLVVRGIVYYPE